MDPVIYKFLVHRPLCRNLDSSGIGLAGRIGYRGMPIADWGTGTVGCAFAGFPERSVDCLGTLGSGIAADWGIAGSGIVEGGMDRMFDHPCIKARL